MKKIHEDYLRSTVFGFQDALVSTTGVIAGVAAGTSNKELIVLAGVVAIAVEALSMGAGQYLSEKSVHELDKEGKHTDNLYIGAGLMFFAYLFGGLVPLTPIILFALPVATTVSIVAALIGLFILGFIKAKLVKVNPVKSAIEMFVLGGLATLIGVFVGKMFGV